VPFVILFTAIVAVAPVWRANHISPIEAFRHDGDESAGTV
jgi:ABC-type lipoprotein release transport system permease subunit